MAHRKTILTASAILAFTAAVPGSVAAQPDRNGGQRQDDNRARPSAPRGPQDQGERQRAPQGTGAAGHGSAQGRPRDAQSPPPYAVPPSVQPRNTTIPDRVTRQQSASPGHDRGSSAAPRPAQAETVRSPAPPAPRRAALQDLRRNVQVERRYRAGAYQGPRGYAQRRWSFGERLPGSYFAHHYWISDYMLYALFAPPAGLVWVRVGHDALLVDRHDGEIIQVRYNVFY